MRAAGLVAYLRTEREGNHGGIIPVLPRSHSRESAALERRTLGVPVRYREEPPLLQKFRAARAANKAPAAAPPVPTATPAPPSAAPVTVDSLGQQLREVLPTRRLHSVSLCDHEANVLWLSEGALGPDEHMLVLEALEALAADASLPCHETALEDGRLAVFLPVRAPMGSLVGIAMILADSKSIGDDTLGRMTAAPVRTIMQRLAVLLRPSGVLDTAHEAGETPEVVETAAVEAAAAEPP